jgi:hypothetical protein
VVMLATGTVFKKVPTVRRTSPATAAGLPFVRSAKQCELTPRSWNARR